MRLLNDLHLVLAGEQVLAVDPLLVGVLQGVVIVLDTDVVVLALPAHVDGPGELVGTHGEVGASDTELVQEHITRLLTTGLGL